MSSFSCPHLDFHKDFCLRLRKDCVPGRPGCVLSSSKYQFAIPAEQRIRAKEIMKEKDEKADHSDR